MIFEFVLLLRLHKVTLANASLRDEQRPRRLVRPKFITANGTVLRIFNDYIGLYPEVVLRVSLRKKKDLMRQEAWARRRIALNRKSGKVLLPEKTSEAFSVAAFQDLLASWTSRRASVPQDVDQPDLLDRPGAV